MRGDCGEGGTGRIHREERKRLGGEPDRRVSVIRGRERGARTRREREGGVRVRWTKRGRMRKGG